MTRFCLSARGFLYICCCSILLGYPTYLRAECKVTLQWDPHGEISDGYRLYERESGQQYNDNHYHDLGQETTCTVSGLEENHTYHFIVRAYVGSDESGDSNEATYECSAASPTDSPDTTIDTPDSPDTTIDTPDSSDTTIDTPDSSDTTIDTPETISPADGAQDVDLEPILTTSEFSDQDPDDTHAQTHWQIFRLDNDECVFDVVSKSSLTAMEVPPSTLEPFTTYYWTVRYFSQNGGKSAPAATSDFTTAIEEEDSPSSSLINGVIGAGSGSSGGSNGIGLGCFIQTLLKGQ